MGVPPIDHRPRDLNGTSVRAPPPGPVFDRRRAILRRRSGIPGPRGRDGV